ncbi:MAG: tyrosine-type recombinase/integrase [Candidatus Korobacteraceae bacterium]
MTHLAPHLTTFLREYLPRVRACSAHTCDAYAYSFQLLLCFAAERYGTSPSDLILEQLDAPLILAFLEYIETVRGNSPRTRNARLAAFKAFAHFLEYRVPSAIEQFRCILAVPFKKTDEALVDYLNRQELQALLDAPDPTTRSGIRDRAMLHLCFSGGLRVSELIGLRLDEVQTHPEASIRVRGKGRRERLLPLWKETAKALRAWLSVRGPSQASELFLSAKGVPLTRSGFEYILTKHVETAATACPSISSKRVSPHVLRHTCAMHTLQATHDVRKVALWLGHASVKSTEIYLRADPAVKLEALEAGVAPMLRRGRFQAPDRLLAMLRSS